MFILKFTFFAFSLHYTIIKAQSEPTTIKISNGLILGQKSYTLTENTTFYAFQGIPYAQPPVNDLRFKVSLPAKNWSGVYNATYDHSECIQPGDNAPTGSENCLFINVFCPELPQIGTPLKPRATIFWIHGGGYSSGSGNLGLHGADYFIDQDILTVSVNYRLGLFGFLTTEDDASVGNYGLKDQILALQWVQENIRYFGGDPDNITIMGQSAGSASVQYLVQSDRANGLFKGAIAESGSTLNPWTSSTNPRQLAFQIGAANLIVTTSSTTLIKRLRGISAYKLQNSATLPNFLEATDFLNGLSFSPHMEKESPEAVVTKKSYDALKSGNFSHVPLLHGFNTGEARSVQTVPWYQYYLYIGRYNWQPSKLAPKGMTATEQNRYAAAQKIREYYLDNGPLAQNPQSIKYLSDNLFVRGIVKATQLRAQYAPTYLYSFAYIGGSQHVNFDPEGVAHAEEIQFLLALPGTQQITSESIGMVHRMSEMWANFAKTGNPTSTLSNYVNVEWPVSNINSSHVTYMNIDVNMTVMVNPEENQMQFWDNLFSEFGEGVYEYNTYK